MLLRVSSLKTGMDSGIWTFDRLWTRSHLAKKLRSPTIRSKNPTIALWRELIRPRLKLWTFGRCAVPESVVLGALLRPIVSWGLLGNTENKSTVSTANASGAAMNGGSFSGRFHHIQKGETWMSASKKLSLSKPIPGEYVPLTTLEYFRARHRRKQHTIVLSEFKRSGITQAELCKRLKKEPAQISRLLGSPTNWSADTYSDLLFAISGAEPIQSVSYPLDMPERNYRNQDWVVKTTDIPPSTAAIVVPKHDLPNRFVVNSRAA